MKAELLQEPWKSYYNETLGPRPTVVLRSLPFYKSNMSRLRYVHRIRSGLIFWWADRPPHVGWRLWCGMHGGSKHGAVMAEPGEVDEVCATCEARALGAGFPSAILLATRPVRFTPRLAS